MEIGADDQSKECLLGRSVNSCLVRSKEHQFLTTRYFRSKLATNLTIIMQLSLQQISAQPGYRSTYEVTPSGQLLLLSKTRRSAMPFSLALEQFFSPSYFPPIIQQDSSVQLIKQEEEVRVPVTCRCKKSRCLKNYCDCFTAGTACGAECGCLGCQNVHSRKRREQSAMAKMGCMCSRSGCRKRYCVCHSVGKKCAWYCKCTNCENMDERDNEGKESEEKEDQQASEESMPKEVQAVEDFLIFQPQALPAKRQRKPNKPQ